MRIMKQLATTVVAGFALLWLASAYISDDVEVEFKFLQPVDGSRLPEGDVFVQHGIFVNRPTVELFEQRYPNPKVCYKLDGEPLLCGSLYTCSMFLTSDGTLFRNLTLGFHTLSAQVTSEEGLALGPEAKITVECVPLPFLGSIISTQPHASPIYTPHCNLESEYIGEKIFRFSTDWFGVNGHLWYELLHPMRDTEVHALELGSWEGRSGLWLLSNILTHPRSTLTSVDYWQGVAPVDVELGNDGFDNESAPHSILRGDLFTMYAALGPEAYQSEAEKQRTSNHLQPEDVGSNVLLRYLHNICSLPHHAWRKVSVLVGPSDLSLLHLLSSRQAAPTINQRAHGAPSSPPSTSHPSTSSCTPSATTDCESGGGGGSDGGGGAGGDRGQFDLVYIDASHQAADVLSDAVLAWKLLRVGGFIIFDDYRWTSIPMPGEKGDPSVEVEMQDWERPRAAIDSFVACYADELDTLDWDAQYVVRKKGRAGGGRGTSAGATATPTSD